MTAITHSTTAAPVFKKEIVFDRESKDYAMYLDGELTGYARTYGIAEATLDALVFELTGAWAADATTPTLHSTPACPTCGNEGECPDCDPRPTPRLPVLLGTVYRPTPCFNCGGMHSVQRCPEVLDALFAPDLPTPDLDTLTNAWDERAELGRAAADATALCAAVVAAGKPLDFASFFQPPPPPPPLVAVGLPDDFDPAWFQTLSVAERGRYLARLSAVQFRAVMRVLALHNGMSEERTVSLAHTALCVARGLDAERIRAGKAAA